MDRKTLTRAVLREMISCSSSTSQSRQRSCRLVRVNRPHGTQRPSQTPSLGRFLARRIDTETPTALSHAARGIRNRSVESVRYRQIRESSQRTDCLRVAEPCRRSFGRSFRALEIDGFHSFPQFREHLFLPDGSSHQDHVPIVCSKDCFLERRNVWSRAAGAPSIRIANEPKCSYKNAARQRAIDLDSHRSTRTSLVLQCECEAEDGRSVYMAT